MITSLRKNVLLGVSSNIRRISLSAIQMQSNSNGMLDVNIESSFGVATVLMRKSPINSLCLKHLSDLCTTLDKLHSEGCRGMVLGSNIPKIFSAGLDITELCPPDETKLRELWRSLQEVWIKLYSSPMVTVAAITGHAPAASCMLTMCCDHRIMVDGKYAIGLNETLMGTVAPWWFSDTMVNTIGHRETERALQLGKLYSPAEALSVGLIDSIVPQDQLLDEVQQTMKQWLKIPDHARHITKLQLRQPTIDRLLNSRQEDIDHFVSYITKETIQKSLEMYLAALKKKSQAK